jgi:NADPH-dependent glutamate synthase beta subunit-like oxidoreductase
VPGEVLHIADAATTIRNLSRRIGDERPAAGNIIWQPVKQMKKWAGK